MLRLYFAPGASSMAPHIALHEIGRPFEAIPVSLGRGENKTAEFLGWCCAIPALLLAWYAAITYIPMARRALKEARVDSLS